MIRLSHWTTFVLCAALAGCASNQYSFLRYGQTPDPNTHQYDPATAPALSDVLALNYASSVAAILRSKYTGARITREVSSTAQIGLAAVGGAGAAAFDMGSSTLAVLGLGSAGIPELQRIFGAKERAQVYQDAVRLIEEGQIEYLAHNQSPSAQILTQNGVTLFQRVTASLHVVEKTLAGNLPSVEDMQKATERMSETGAKATAPGSTPANLVPANGSGPIRKVAQVVIDRSVKVTKGLQPEAVAIITRTNGEIIRSMKPEEAQTAVKLLTGNDAPDTGAKTTLFNLNTDTEITAERAVEIQGALNKAKH